MKFLMVVVIGAALCIFIPFLTPLWFIMAFTVYKAIKD